MFGLQFVVTIKRNREAKNKFPCNKNMNLATLSGCVGPRGMQGQL